MGSGARRLALWGIALLGVSGLSLGSITLGATGFDLSILPLRGSEQAADAIFWASRLPRTAALLLSGAALAVAGQIMQSLSRNRFVEPATAGTAEAASLGLLVVMLTAPGMDVLARMAVTALFALGGTSLFLLLLSRVPLRSPYVVPLIGLMLGGVLGAITTFFAYRADLMQSLAAWLMGDFSGILAGRYELLWIAGGLALAAYLYADRLTVLNLGEGFTRNLGLNHHHIMAIGLVIVSLITASVIVTCGMIPFVGLIVPNLVSMAMGDSLRRALPWVALGGAALVLACDLLGRALMAPYEMPVGTTMGVVGGAVFLAVLWQSRKPRRGRTAVRPSRSHG